ncbi:peptidoglycan-binding protein [Streptacidiphilus sp. MAP5-3]|uniref:peptidoglycan-binding domain-containing protein n=1 Tax=unclassified Streptacidiphilus TaxID=2643834 RepID=UPI00351188AF
MEPDADLVRPYVARLGGQTVETAVPAVEWGDTAPSREGPVPAERRVAPGPTGPVGGGADEHRGSSPRGRRVLLLAGALLTSAAAALILAGTLGGGTPVHGSAPALASATSEPVNPTVLPQRSPLASRTPTDGATTRAALGHPVSPSASPTPSSAVSVSVSGAASPSADGTLRPGDTGPAVTHLQQLLFEQGFTYVSTTGVYDAATTRGVTQLQQDRDLTGDPPGVYGPATRASLEGSD